LQGIAEVVRETNDHYDGNDHRQEDRVSHDPLYDLHKMLHLLPPDVVPFCYLRAVARVSRGGRLNEKPVKVVMLAAIPATSQMAQK
jgi:hypothetical protein